MQDSQDAASYQAHKEVSQRPNLAMQTNSSGCLQGKNPRLYIRFPSQILPDANNNVVY